MMDTGRLNFFVRDVIITHNREEDDRKLWDMWTMKVQDDSTYEEFVKKATVSQENQKMDREAVKTGVKKSMGIMKNFKPDIE